MKKIYKFSALVCAAVFSFTSCLEENLEVVTPANDGDEILFGARAGFETNGTDTKTVYSGEYYGPEGNRFERIDWVDDVDAIQIYCPEADGPNPSHYTINHAADHGEQKDYAYLTKNGENSLQWKGDDVHHFYAMYPSSDMFSADQSTLAQGITMDRTTLKGTVPGTQTPTSITCADGTNWVAEPNMKYAYMAARSTATREDGSVSLTFVPIVTAVQIQLTLDEKSLDPVSIAELQVQGNGIVGNFHAELSEDKWTGVYPPCTNDGAGNGIIQVPMWVNSNPITVSPGQTLTFTVFLRPGADYSNLKVSYSPNGAGYIGKTMGGTGDEAVSIPRNLKTVIKGFKLPARFKEEDETITIDASRWMTQVADEVQLKKLSIPGTGGSFTYKYSSGNNAKLFRSQHTTMDIPAQWKAGIRAFEIVSDRPNNEGTSSLGSEQITCNKTDVGITVSAAMELINTQLNNNPNECAVVIFTYQPEGNSPARHATYYAQSLKRWYDGITYQDKFLKYTPDLTMGTARGKILVLVRLNQRNESESGSFSGAVNALSGYPFVLIDGCGTGKDKWGARGYTITGSNGTTIVAPDISNGVNTSTGEYIEKYLRSGFIDPTTHANVRRGDMNFNYPTETDKVECWYQEWARVLPQNTYIESGRWGYGSYAATYWFESYSEKLMNATETFKMAISDGFPNYLFVNSLSGYMATDATKGSPTYSLVPSYGTGYSAVYGGDGGDIAALAVKLNSDFYQFVLKAGMDQTTGPTGIVMMDYVRNTPTDENGDGVVDVEFDGAYLLPGVIIANNFKHGSGNGNNPGGGNGPGDTDDPEDEEDGI